MVVLYLSVLPLLAGESLRAGQVDCRGGRLADLGQNPDLITLQPVWKNSFIYKIHLVYMELARWH